MSGRVFDRHKWQMDLAQWLVAQGIRDDWTVPANKPGWMRKMNLLPCDCKTCYFCVRGFTSGVQHKPKVSAAQKAEAAATATAAATAVKTHAWVQASSENRCGLCLDAGTKKGLSGKARTDGARKSRYTCLGCDPTGRPICKKCRAAIDSSVPHA